MGMRLLLRRLFNCKFYASTSGISTKRTLREYASRVCLIVFFVQPVGAIRWITKSTYRATCPVCCFTRSCKTTQLCLCSLRHPKFAIFKKKLCCWYSVCMQPFGSHLAVTDRSRCLISMDKILSCAPLKMTCDEPVEQRCTKGAGEVKLSYEFGWNVGTKSWTISGHSQVIAKGSGVV